MTHPALLADVPLERKVRLLTGADFWALHAEPALGLRRIVTSDGPAGVRGELWDERDPSANVPSPTALAATWDDGLLTEIGTLLAAEARSKAVDVVLAPTLNLHRSPYGGRHFECFSEDPLLTGRTGLALVRAVQSAGVAVCVKHFVANDAETDRLNVDDVVDARTLREVYLAPFETAVRDGGAWSVMAAYNQVNGTTMTASPLLGDVLRGEWGFDGVVMSDWYAGRETVATILAGLDLCMPGPTGPWGDALVAAVRDGRVPEQAVDLAVTRILRLADRVGALDGGAPRPVTQPGADEVHSLLRRTAAAGFLLLRNEQVGNTGPLLPLPRTDVRVAVIGPNAEPGRSLGGGSAFVFPDREITPLAGLREAFGDAQVRYAEGVRAHARIGIADPAHLTAPGGAEPGVAIDFLGRDGRVLASDVRRGTAYTWNNAFAPGVDPAELGAITLATVLTAPDAGTYTIGVSGVGPFRVALDGDVVFDGVLALDEGADPVEGLMRPPQTSASVDLEKGEQVEVTVTRAVPDREPGADLLVSLQLNVDLPYAGDDAAIAEAVALAADSEVAVVVVGTNEEVESEGFDRDSLALPGRQGDLVRAVVAANPRTVVVVNAGAPVTMPWRDEVPAVLLVWFPGQEFGHALAGVLTGLAEPGGRLPTTWPAVESASLPSTRPVDGKVRYDEGLHVGYRRFLRDGVEPAYWLGHGLGYTTWEYGDLQVSADGLEVSVTVTNAGERTGRELVQVYLTRSRSAVERPVRWLAGYAWADAAPGATVSVVIDVPERAYEHWDAEVDRWALEPGGFGVQVGRSAGDIRLEAAVTR